MSYHSLLRGHERSPLDAAVSTFHSLSKFPLLPCGAIAFVAGVALGMSGPASAANLAVSYSATGELADPDGNTTPIDVQNTASDSTAGKSRSVSLKLDNKTITTDGANGAVDASAHAAYGELGVDAFASAAASVLHGRSWHGDRGQGFIFRRPHLRLEQPEKLRQASRRTRQHPSRRRLFACEYQPDLTHISPSSRLRDVHQSRSADRRLQHLRHSAEQRTAWGYKSQVRRRSSRAYHKRRQQSP